MTLAHDQTLLRRVTEYYESGASQFVLDLGLTVVAATPGEVHFTMPVTPRLVHAGGVLCGQAIMAGMDTGMVFVMASLAPDTGDVDDIGPFTTVHLQTTFERGVPGDVGSVEFVARATKPGRTLVFGEIDLLLPDGKRAAHATTTYMWL